MPSVYSRPEESIGLALRKTQENLACPQDLLRAGWQASESTLHNRHAASFQRISQHEVNHDGLQAQDGQPKPRVASSRGHCSLAERHSFSLRQVDSNVILKEDFIFHLF